MIMKNKMMIMWNKLPPSKRNLKRRKFKHKNVTIVKKTFLSRKLRSIQLSVIGK